MPGMVEAGASAANAASRVVLVGSAASGVVCGGVWLIGGAVAGLFGAWDVDVDVRTVAGMGGAVENCRAE